MGCQRGSAQKSIVGEWECDDLKNFEHISHFAKLTMVFRPDGKVITFLTDIEGVQTSHDTDDYSLSGGILRFKTGRDEYRCSVTNNILSLTMSTTKSEKDVEKSLFFRYKLRQ